MKLILLPGLDGTGELFNPLIEYLPNSFDIKVIQYNPQKQQDYSELLEYVLFQLPQENFILIAESFSGVIAYQIALKKLQYLQTIIFVATFLENPRKKLLKIINFLPLNLIFSVSIPTFIIKQCLLGTKINKQSIELFNQTLKKVNPNILAFRVNEIATLLPPPNQHLNLKVAYIQATNDVYVTQNAYSKFQELFKNITLYRVNGSHLILQSNPKDCAKVIHLICSKLQ